jgi:glycine C-acetyltransferase
MLRDLLEKNKGTGKRVLVIKDGVFSMIGELQDIGKMQHVISEYQNEYEEGVISIVDDAHGIGALGTGRGVEEVTGGRCDLLVGTMGKAFGVDGGYVVGDQVFIDYLRESAATYIYSNPISPGTAAASLESVKLIDSDMGQSLLRQLRENITYFKEKVIDVGFKFVADSSHPIQPILIGDPRKTRELVDALFEEGFLVTNISYPVVPKGKDEIRVQVSAIHTKNDINEFLDKLEKTGKKLKIL